ncbi:hypothetical protein EV189_1848 [Motilibacter rhizosphaerae]|uniref:TadE-like protein n=1 Tax=Motilibacter rhizosphaerae TaxID=598652 RepID=A0A4Q7NSQ7_9ACTN|nr:hypothetical protein [Motilibacter rhizosphaerae]RZS90065.1 hypothetical protein EV189_1848 [Motilibacter rhizosphaerae]
MSSDDGSATIEVFGLALLLLVPLVWVLVAASTVQSTAYAVAAAARDASRAYVTTPGGAPSEAEARARAAAAVALGDFGVDPDDVEVTADGTLDPGAYVTVRLQTTVRLPFLPRSLSRRAVRLSGTGTSVVDDYR